MSQRLDYYKISPNAVKGFYATSAYIAQCGLPTDLIDFVYLRVSQINGCAFCIDKHSRDLLKKGVTSAKLVLTAVWREAGSLFDEREQAALAWAECVAKVDISGVPDEAFASVSQVFNEREVVDLTMAISLMSAFNRLGVSMRMVPEALTSAVKPM